MTRSARGFSRTALLVTVIVIAAMLAVLNLLVGEPLRDAAESGETRADATGVRGGTLEEGESGSLEAAPGADPFAREARERARRAAAAGPSFPRSEGVFGVVMDGRGKPIAKATVRLVAVPPEQVTRWWQPGPDPEPIATATSAEDGSFVVGPAPEGAVLRVRGEAPGFAATSVQVARRGTRVDLVLDQGGELKVRVLDGEGAPLADATVVHSAGTVATTATTDAEGHAVLAAVPTGQGTLLVAKAGHGAARRPDVSVSPGQSLEVTVLLGKPLVLTGRVVRAKDERPVRDALLTLTYPTFTATGPPEPTRSGDDGTFRMDLAAPAGETFVLTAEADGMSGRVSLNVNDTGGGTMDAVVKLDDAPISIVGRVVDARGTPAEGVLVTVSWHSPGAKAPETTTDRDGRFDLRLPPGSAPGSWWFLVATSDTLGMGAAQVRLPAKSEQRPEPPVLTLSGTGTVKGHVTGESGPVEGALVSLSVDWSLPSRGPGRAGGALMNLLQDPRRAAGLSAVTGADGSFLLPSVPAATFRITATHGQVQASPNDPVVVTAGDVTEVLIPLGSGLTIEGVVLDEVGNPVPGAWVYANAQRGGGGWAGRSVGARSQSDGTFVVRGVGDGTWMVHAYAAGFSSQGTANVTGGTTGLTIRLQAMGWIEGVVLEGSRPYRGAFSVSAGLAQPEGPGGGERGWGGQNEQTFNTDDGRFVMRGLSAGTWVLQARTPDGRITRAPLKVDVGNGRGTTDVALVLAAGATVTGTVVSDETGDPISGANLQFTARSGPDGSRTNVGAATDARGRFSARGLAPGAYLVHVNPPSGVGWQEDIEVREGETKDVRWVERSPGKVRVYVVDAEERPLAGAQPKLTTASGGQVWPAWQALQREGLVDTTRGADPWQTVLRTDASGVNLRHHVPPGRYQVSADLQGYAQAGEAPWIEVASRRTTEVTVVLKKSDEAPAGDGGER